MPSPRSQPCPVLSHREEVQAALSSLRASRWIDHSTRSVSVHFTLFHAPSRLFTSVSLGVEILPSGALIPSTQVDSVGILRSDSALGHCLMLSEVSVLWLRPPGVPGLGVLHMPRPLLVAFPRHLHTAARERGWHSPRMPGLCS